MMKEGVLAFIVGSAGLHGVGYLADQVPPVYLEPAPESPCLIIIIQGRGK